jgi:hypothetical protein
MMSDWRTPLFSLLTGLIGAAIGFGGSVYVANIQSRALLAQAETQGRATVAQAHESAQASLAIEAVKTGATCQSAKNLLFLIKVGLLDDPKHEKENAIRLHPEDTPVLPATGYGKGGYGLGGFNVGGLDANGLESNGQKLATPKPCLLQK